MNIEPAEAHRKYLPDGYRKRKVIVSRRAPGKAQVRSYWDGGSRSYFSLVRNGVHSGVTRDINPLHAPDRDDTCIELIAGDVLVQTGIFCGKKATAIITYVEKI